LRKLKIASILFGLSHALLFGLLLLKYHDPFLLLALLSNYIATILTFQEITGGERK